MLIENDVHGIEGMGCIRCDRTECLDLYKKSKDSEDAGGELYVYSLLIDKILEQINDDTKDLRTIICDNGVFLKAMCFLSVPLYIKDKNEYLAPIFVQVTRDLKASLYLAFSGHYRSSLQVLRCAFENMIVGVKYQCKYIQYVNTDSDKKLAKLRSDFDKWLKYGYEKIRRSIRDLYKYDFLTKEEVDNWIKFYSDLSRFIHTPEEFYNRVIHEEYEKLKGEITCPATTYYNELQLIEWSMYYQKIISIMIKILSTFHPEVFATESGELAVNNLLIPWLETERAYKYIEVTEEILETLRKFQT